MGMPKVKPPSPQTKLSLRLADSSPSVDLQAIGEPRYALQMDVVDLYKTEVGASEPQEDFYDRHELYGM